MNKRIMCICLAILMVASLLAGCGNSKQTTVITTFSWEPAAVEDAGLGVILPLPKDMVDQGMLLLQDPGTLPGEDPQTAPETQRICYFLPGEGDYPLFGIARYELPKWEALIAQGLTPEEITGADAVEELWQKNDLIYLFTQPQADLQSLSQEQQETYRTLQSDLPSIRESITALVSAGEMRGMVLPEFSVGTLAGETADNSIFSGQALTMVNIWGTFCSPCIAEMPMLEALSQAMPEGTRLVGIVSDITERDTSEALRILEETGVTFPNLIAEGSLLAFLEDTVIGFPTTVFVDPEGNVIGDAVIGAQSRDMYETILAERLAMVKE